MKRTTAIKSFCIILIIGIMLCCLCSCLQGEQGLQGEKGEQGIQGEKGEQGLQGEKGEQGIQGEKGEQGEQGIQGEKGEQGEQGIQGEKGEQGEQGIQGEKGANGKSAYQLYREKYGYTGSEDEWLEEIHIRFGEYTSEQIYDLAKKSCVKLECYNEGGEHISSGSGFFIDNRGTILTACHVVDGAHSVKAITYNSTEYTVDKIVGFDQDRDMAIISTSTTESTPFLPLSTGGVTAGETVYTFGCSLGILENTFSVGVVASNLRKTEIEDKNDSFLEIQFTAPISSGNSGGPIINTHGEVVGVVCWQYLVGNSLNFGTHIGELEKIDRTYNKAPDQFYNDVQYYKVKLADSIVEESEPNNAKSTSNFLNNGDTGYGVTYKGDTDVYKIRVKDNEDVDFTISYVVSDIREKVITPLMYDSGGNQIELNWFYTTLNDSDLVFYYAYATLDKGVYYINVEGYLDQSIDDTPYYLYTYWDTVSNYNNFEYSIHTTDFIG